MQFITLVAHYCTFYFPVFSMIKVPMKWRAKALPRNIYKVKELTYTVYRALQSGRKKDTSYVNKKTQKSHGSQPWKLFDIVPPQGGTVQLIENVR